MMEKENIMQTNKMYWDTMQMLGLGLRLFRIME